MGGMADTQPATPPPTASEIALTYGCIVLWIVLSGAVILINKLILSTFFPFPVALTLSHMGFCSILAWLLVRTGVARSVAMDTDIYIRCVVPVAALFAATLWMSNAAYMYLSVAFIQMLKAAMPITVFVVGVFMGTEVFYWSYASNMLLVGVGVAVASYGELNFSLIGVLLQSGSIVTESLRLVMIQVLLQRRGIRLNPVTTLYYVAPACFAFLCIPFACLELPVLMRTATVDFQPGLLVASAVCAFALNMSVFLLIGRSSALTMNVAGVIKDWGLIGISTLIYRAPITGVQLAGYGVSFIGVCWYNHHKLQQMTSPPPPGTSARNSSEKTPLLSAEQGKGAHQNGKGDA